MEPRSIQKNAADPKQVKHAGRTEKKAREIELDDLRAVLVTEPGRRVLYRVLAYCKVFGDVYDESPHRTAFNAGLKNVGAHVMGEITAANEEALFLMMREQSASQRRAAVEAEAVRTPNASDNGGVTNEDQ